jgi:hypothetical protein
MEGDGSGSFQLEIVGRLGECINDSLRLPRGYHQVICHLYVACDVLVVITAVSHPNVSVHLGGVEVHSFQ